MVGSGGAIKLREENAVEQKFRLRMEGVTFRGARVDMKRHEFRFQKVKGARSKKVIGQEKSTTKSTKEHEG